MGDTESGSRLPAEMHRLRAPDHDTAQDGREEYEGIEEAGITGRTASHHAQGYCSQYSADFEKKNEILLALSRIIWYHFNL